MRVVFMGTPAFAVPSLDALIGAHEVVLVVTRPDRASGRGGELRASPVKTAALARGLDVQQPARLDEQAVTAIAALRPDVICVAAYGALLPRELLELPSYGCLNVHASLLPRYRGAAPIQRAILDGAPESGVSIMRMEAGLDTGPYALQRKVEVGERYAPEIEAEMASVGAVALLEVLDALASDTITWTRQDVSAATYAAKVTKGDVALMPDLAVATAFARVRASSPSAPARACLGDRELTVVRAHPIHHRQGPGALCLVDGLPAIGFADGSLALEVVRPAGKRDMAAADWARGAHLSPDACWRCTR